MATTKKAPNQKIGYRGNINLKPLGYKHQLTQFEASEYEKCAYDPIYFIETYVFITTLDHGSRPFKLYPYQKKLILSIHYGRKTIAKVGRQQGKTQCSAAYILWYTLFQKVVTVGVLANKSSAARETLSRYQDMYQSIPLWMQQGIVDWNKGNVTLENGSKIFTNATSRDAIRGRSCVTGDTFITVRNKITGEIKTLPIGEFSSLLNIDTNANSPRNINEWEILTPSGFSDFFGIDVIHERKILTIVTECTSVTCTLDHKVKLTNTQFVESQHLCIGDTLEIGGAVTNIIHHETLETVYDPLEIVLGHEYVANGIVHHNCNLIYVDEVAIIPNNIAEEFFTAVYPTISSGTTTKILLTSTPMGYNAYWKIWDEAIKGINDFTPIEVHYSEIPGRNDAWAAQQLKLLGELKFSQEVLCTFIGSSLTLIRGDVISKLSRQAYEYSKDNLDITSAPNPNHSYILVADTSRGVGGDYSAFTVIDVTELPYKLVAKFRDNKISPMLYPSVIHRVATDYNEAMVLVEINDIGGQVADILYQDLEYENIFFVTKEKGGQKLATGFSNNIQAGVRTDKLVKRVGCSTLKSLVEENKLIITDSDAIAEISTFTETKTGFFAADIGYHDDIVITLVLFAWMTTQAYFKDLTNSDLRKSLYDSQINNIEQTLTPFGIIEDGKKPEKSFEVLQGELWEVADAPQRYEDFGRSLMKAELDAWNW